MLQYRGIKRLRNMRLVVTRILMVFVLYAASSGFAFASDLIQTKAKQAIIVDHASGVVLFSKNADERMPTSSMSKVMTMYLVFDALKRGDLKLDDTFLVSEKAWKKGGSKMFVPVGKQVKVEDLIRGVIIQSGNDATIVLAEGLAGGEAAFAEALTKKAKEIGMHSSQFKNASGWPDPEHYSTARDLSILASAMVTEFPSYYKYYAEKEFTFSKIRQTNRNPLLTLGIGADGIKTGHTDDGGYGLIASGVNKDGRRMILVLNGMASKKERKQESARLLQWALNSFKTISLFGDDAEDLAVADVYLGKKDKIALRAGKPLEFMVPKIFANDLKVEVNYDSPIKAPIKKGDALGTITVHVPKGDIVEVPLVASHSVKEMSFFTKMVMKARLLTTGEGVFK